MYSVGRIELEPEFKAITRKALPRWWDNERVAAKVAAMHGCVIGQRPLNEHGVFVDYSTIRITGGKSEKEAFWCYAKIHLVQTPRGHWLFSLDTRIHWESSGSLPGIRDTVVYATRQGAIEEALSRLIRKCELKIANVHEEKLSRQRAKLLLEAVRREQANLLPQMSIF